MSIRAVSASVVVRDRAKAARWYTETLGFRLFAEDPDHWTTVGDRSGMFLLHLCEFEGKPGQKLPKSEVGNTGILLWTDEPFARTVARLKKRKVRFSMQPKKLPWGWLAKFLDPDGNEFWLMPAE
jgi:catechol 2,3-dioxygenase-like lactoylglutathione lyase family enzyme